MVSEFSKTHQVKFNPDKTGLLIFKHASDIETSTILLLCGEPIVIERTVKYLGVMVNDSFNNKDHIEKRIKLAYSSIGNLYSTGVLNRLMSINTKISLFEIYIKPLLYYGIESLDINKGDLNEIGKCESSIVKQMIGISKYCHTTDLFSALNINTAEESLYISKFKFIQRMERNEYTKQFMEELREVNTTTGSLSRVVKYMGLEQTSNNTYISINILDNIDEKLESIKQNMSDRFKYNPKVNEIKEILEIQNIKFRTFKFYKKLSNNNFLPISLSRAQTNINKFNQVHRNQ